MRPALVTLAAAVLTLAAGPARAGPARGAKAPAARPKVLRLEEMEVEARVQKPQAVFVIPRAQLQYGGADRLEPLLPKVTQGLEKELFDAPPAPTR